MVWKDGEEEAGVVVEEGWEWGHHTCEVVDCYLLLGCHLDGSYCCYQAE